MEEKYRERERERESERGRKRKKRGAQQMKNKKREREREREYECDVIRSYCDIDQWITKQWLLLESFQRKGKSLWFPISLSLSLSQSLTHSQTHTQTLSPSLSLTVIPTFLSCMSQVQLLSSVFIWVFDSWNRVV